jgi:hypothetical protein
VAPHVVGGRAGALMDLAPALIHIGHRLGLVDGRLGRLELLALGDDRPRLVEPLPELSGGVSALVAVPPSEEAGRQSADSSGCTGQNRDAAPHDRDATLLRSSCPGPLRALPSAVGTRPLDRRRRVTGP